MNLKTKNPLIRLKVKLIQHLKTIKKNLDNVVIAYEPIWSIGRITPKKTYLDNFFKKIKDLIKKILKKYSSFIWRLSFIKNISSLKNIDCCDGFLIGGASLKTQNFIDIIKKYYI